MLNFLGTYLTLSKVQVTLGTVNSCSGVDIYFPVPFTAFCILYLIIGEAVQSCLRASGAPSMTYAFFKVHCSFKSCNSLQKIFAGLLYSCVIP